MIDQCVRKEQLQLLPFPNVYRLRLLPYSDLLSDEMLVPVYIINTRKFQSVAVVGAIPSECTHPTSPQLSSTSVCAASSPFLCCPRSGFRDPSQQDRVFLSPFSSSLPTATMPSYPTCIHSRNKPQKEDKESIKMEPINQETKRKKSEKCLSFIILGIMF